VGAAPILLNGCAGITSASNNSRPPAAIQVTPATVSFGSVVVGKKGSQIVSVANTGSAAVNIAQVNVSGSQVTGQVTAGGFCGGLAAGGSLCLAAARVFTRFSVIGSGLSGTAGVSLATSLG